MSKVITSPNQESKTEQFNELEPEDGEFFEAPHDWWWRDYKYSHAIHDVNWLYTDSYFDEMSEYWHAENRVGRFVTFLMEQLPQGTYYTAVDVGCGEGTLVRALADRGFQYTMGIDGSASAIQAAPSRQRLDPHRFVHHDVRRPFRYQSKFCLCTCMEVAEHLEPPFASQLVQNLVNLSNTIYFTAAEPGSYGDGKAHVNHPNEAPAKMWKNLFNFYGYDCVKDLTEGGGYRENGMFFKNRNPRRVHNGIV